MGVEAIDGPGLNMRQVLAGSLFTNCALSGNSNFQKNVIFGDSHFTCVQKSVHNCVCTCTYVHSYLILTFDLWFSVFRKYRKRPVARTGLT